MLFEFVGTKLMLIRMSFYIVLSGPAFAAVYHVCCLFCLFFVVVFLYFFAKLPRSQTAIKGGFDLLNKLSNYGCWNFDFRIPATLGVEEEET